MVSNPDRGDTAPLTLHRFEYPYEYDFDIEKGTECDRFDDGRTATDPVFWGYCYFCDVPKHSQNYCPLRYCPSCDKFGHSIKICSEASKVRPFQWRKRNTQSTRRNKTTDNETETKIPFGSTWKSERRKINMNRDWRQPDFFELRNSDQ